MNIIELCKIKKNVQPFTQIQLTNIDNCWTLTYLQFAYGEGKI